MANRTEEQKERTRQYVHKAVNVGRVKRLKNEGYSFEDIVIKTGLDEATVRECLDIIAEAEANRNKNK